MPVAMIQIKRNQVNVFITDDLLCLCTNVIEWKPFVEKQAEIPKTFLITDHIFIKGISDNEGKMYDSYYLLHAMVIGKSM